MFSEDVRFRYFINLAEQLIKEYSEIAENNGVVIWGTGAFGEFINSIYKAMNKNDLVKCFCDSYHDDTTTIKTVDEVQVYSPFRALKEFPSATFIIASSFHKEILSSISNQGLNISRVYQPKEILLNSKFSIINYIRKLSCQ